MKTIRLKTRQKRHEEYCALGFNLKIPVAGDDEGPLINAIVSNGFQHPSYYFSSIASMGDDAGEEIDGWCIDYGNQWNPRVTVSGETHKAIVKEGLEILKRLDVSPLHWELNHKYRD